MKVKFKKDHPAGVKKGRETDVPEHIAKKWQEEGYVEIYTKELNVKRTKKKA